MLINSYLVRRESSGSVVECLDLDRGAAGSSLTPRHKMTFGQQHAAINIYNICKGHFGCRGRKHLKIN